MRSLRLKVARLEERLMPALPKSCPHCAPLRGPSRSGPLPHCIIFHEDDGRTMIICKWCGWCCRAWLREEGGRTYADGAEEAEAPF